MTDNSTPDEQIELLLMGAPQLRHRGARVTFDTRKALALLAFLVVTGKEQARDTLAALLWPEQDQESARGALRRTLSTLNKGLQGKALIIKRETIALEDSEGFRTDTVEFGRHIQAARVGLAKSSGLEAKAADRLEKAAQLWQGEFMQGFSLRDAPEFEEWQSQTAENLRRDLVWALEKLAMWQAATQQLEPALTHARRWLELDPLNETAHRAVMQFLAGQGKTGLALKQYQECVRILERELGVPPLEATTNLYQAIKEQRFESPELPPVTAVPSNQNNALIAAVTTAPTVAPTPNSPVESEPTPLEFPLVGRESERLALETAVKGIQGGAKRGRLIAVEGEAGVGKTRIIEEFLAGQRTTGRTVTAVNCYEGETEMAFLAISAALQKAYGKLDTPGKKRLENLPPEWRREAARLFSELGANLPPAESLDNIGAQSRFYEGLRQTLLALTTTSEEPGLLFFDDLQWMDRASLDFLSYLANRLAGEPLALILTWRSGTLESRPTLHKLITVAQRSGVALHFTLARLSEAQVKMLVAQTLPGQTRETPQLSQKLFSETEGLPLFLVEYLKAYRLGKFEPKMTPPEPSGLELPQGVLSLLESRLISLSEPAHQLLHSAAVIGKSFDFDTLREVSGRSEDETVAGLEELTGASVVTEVAASANELRYDFRHEKLRRVVYERTSLARRRLLHRRAAEALANRKTAPGKGQALAQVAFHFRQAGDESRAALYYKQAGDYARSLFANREALTHYQEALTLGFSETGRLYENLGDLYTLLGEYTPALHQYVLAQSPTEPAARLEYKVGKVYLWRGDWKLALSQFEAVSELNGFDPNLSAQLYTDWGLALHRLGRDEEARQLAEKALDEATSNDDLEAQARTYNFLGLLAGHRREIEPANEFLKKSLNLSEKLNDPSLQAAALNNLAWVSRANGAYERAIVLTDAALAIVATQGDRHRQAALLSNLGDLYQATGQPDKARDFVRQSIVIYAEIGVEQGAFQPGIWMLTEW